MTEDEKQALVEDFKEELANNHREIEERREKLIRETGHALPKSRQDYLLKTAKENLRNLYKKKTIYLIVDVDGVISPLNSFEGDYIEVRGNHCNWAIRPEVADWLEDVQNKVTFIWGSSWEEQSNLIFKTLELPSADYIDFDKIDPDSQWLKNQGYFSYLDKVKANDTVIIIDDEIPELEKQLLENRGVKVFKPKGALGLTDEEIIEINFIIENFLKTQKRKK